MTNVDTRTKVLSATLELAAEKPFLSVALGEIATRAGVDLSTLRQRYADRIAILSDFAASIDEQVLAGGTADGTGFGEPARDRLFDVLMRRFDALAPYRAGLKGIHSAARRDPLFAATLNRIAVGSHKWTLAAADLEPSGPFAPVRRLARAQAIALVMAQVMPVFLDDEAADLPKTMAALDKALESLDRTAKTVTRMEEAVDKLFERLTAKRTSGKAEEAAPATEAPAAQSSPVRPTGVFTRDEMAKGGAAAGDEPASDDTASDNGAASAVIDAPPEDSENVSRPARGSGSRRPRQPKS
jgi:AcrR family transcriptional regulator